VAAPAALTNRVHPHTALCGVEVGHRKREMELRGWWPWRQGAGGSRCRCALNSQWADTEKAPRAAWGAFRKMVVDHQAPDRSLARRGGGRAGDSLDTPMIRADPSRSQHQRTRIRPRRLGVPVQTKTQRRRRNPSLKPVPRRSRSWLRECEVAKTLRLIRSATNAGAANFGAAGAPGGRCSTVTSWGVREHPFRNRQGKMTQSRALIA